MCGSICWPLQERVPYREVVFTGIVEELGSLRAAEGGSGSTRLTFEARLVTDGCEVGDSIAVNGCCLTVVDKGTGWWAADAVAETLARTSLGELRPGDPVNLERPLALGGRLGGHLVQGHVDAVGRVLRAAPDLHVGTDRELRPYIVPKGSVAVDGVSLTVVELTEDGFTVAVIPHTLSVTTLGRKRAGDPVNLEVDVIAKYAESLLQAGVESPYRTAATAGA
jgi:riboflavin synthase